jgi:hypothetical protein
MPRTSAFLLALLFAATSAFSNPITDENARPGTDRWRLRQPANAQISGYASSTSVTHGETIDLFVSTTDPAYTIEIFRTGWYDGLGGRRMTDAIERTGIQQTVPAADANGMIECNWTDPYTVTIPADWLSGVYLAKLTGAPSGNQSYILFVVRDDRRADFVFQSTVTTYQAYNNWGGKSLYGFNSTGAPARKVSFNRPYASGFGTGGYLFDWEYDFVRFAEREGYDVTYTTNVDTHAGPDSLLRARAFLSVGHDEYWTWEMRTHIEAARDAGVHLGFFSANNCYWQIRFENQHRTIVGYKDAALASDPFASDGNPSNDHLVTTKWRDVPVSRPEEALFGVMYGESQIDGDIVIDNPSHWVFAGTGLKKGDKLEGLLGYEVDAIQGVAPPPGVVRLAHSPYVNDHGETGFSDMTILTTTAGTIVFSAGTIQWSWGLDAFGDPDRVARQSEAAKQITRNVLNRMKAVPRRRAVRK